MVRHREGGNRGLPRWLAQADTPSTTGTGAVNEPVPSPAAGCQGNENGQILKAYANLQKTMETLGAQLRKAEKQIYALEEGLTDLRPRVGQLEETTENLGAG